MKPHFHITYASTLELWADSLHPALQADIPREMVGLLNGWCGS